MNRLPLNFYDALLPMFHIRTVEKLRHLAGRYGALAHEMFANRYYHEINIEDGVIIEEYIFNYGRAKFHGFDIPPLKKFLRNVNIILTDCNEGHVKSGICKRIREVQGHHECVLELHSDTVSKDWIDWACSWKGLTCLNLTEILKETAIELFKKLVDTCKLKQFRVCFGENEFPLIKSVLVQDQFDTLNLTFYNEDQLEELFQFCSENSARVKGKKIHLHWAYACDVRVSTPFEGILELCSTEESESIEKDYFFFCRIFFCVSSKPYKFLNGDSLVYVFFDCDGKEKKVDELEFLKKSHDLMVLFA